MLIKMMRIKMRITVKENDSHSEHFIFVNMFILILKLFFLEILESEELFHSFNLFINKDKKV